MGYIDLNRPVTHKRTFIRIWTQFFLLKKKPNLSNIRIQRRQLWGKKTNTPICWSNLMTRLKGIHWFCKVQAIVVCCSHIASVLCTLYLGYERHQPFPTNISPETPYQIPGQWRLGLSIWRNIQLIFSVHFFLLHICFLPWNWEVLLE